MNSLPLSTYELHSTSLVKKIFLATTFLLLFTCFCKGGVSSPGPLNDNCVTAMELTIGETHLQSLCGASIATQQPAGLELEIYDVWFKITMDDRDALTLRTQNLEGELYGMSIYEGNNCGAFDADFFMGPVQNDIGIDFHANFSLTEGDVFYVQIWSAFQSCADVEITLESHTLGCTDVCNINYNPDATLDDSTCIFTFEYGQHCWDAFAIDFNFFDEDFNLEASQLVPCWMPIASDPESSPVNGGLYYHFIGTGDGILIHSCDLFGVSEFHVYKVLTVCQETMEYIGRSTPSDETCIPGYSNSKDLAFQTEAGETYFIYISTWDDDGIDYIDYPAAGRISFGTFLPGDFDLDGNINGGDLLFFLSEFSCTGSECMGDLNQDGVVNSADLLCFLSSFA